MEALEGTQERALQPADALLPALHLPRIQARTRTLIANAALGGMILSAFVMAAGAASKVYGPTLHVHHPLPTSLRGPLHLLGFSVNGTEFSVAFIVLTVCYFGVMLFAESVRLRVALGAIVLLHVIFLIAPPLLSSDIFNYVGYSRLEVVHHLNAYVKPLAAVPTDPSYIYVGWPLHTTAYGPLFTLASFPLGWVSFPAAVWLIKFFTAIASLGCVALVWLCARRLGRPPLPAAMFFGLNPILLAYAVGGGHNDVLMLAAALGGVYLLLAGRQSGMAALVASAAIKTTSVILLPFALLGSRRPIRGLIWAGGAAVVLGVMTLAVFGHHVSSLLHVLHDDARLQTPNDIPGVIRDIFGLHVTTRTLGQIGMVVFAIAVIFLLIRTYRGGNWLENAGWATCALIVTTTWFLPWYLIWFLPLAALALKPYQRLTALVLTGLAIGLQLPLIFGH
jgi:glycosyl transferase family 87